MVTTTRTHSMRRLHPVLWASFSALPLLIECQRKIYRRKESVSRRRFQELSGTRRMTSAAASSSSSPHWDRSGR